MNNFKQTIINEWKDTKLLIRNTPPLVMVFLCIALVLMNIFAGKELLNLPWLALDCGFTLSWIVFLCMDMLTRRFGGKAAIKLSLLATIINLAVSLILFLLSLISGNWSVFYTYEDNIVNTALDSTFGGSWYVILGSTVAFVVAAIVNAVINVGIGKLMESNNFRTFAVRSYVSTAIGQFVDNLIFAFIVSYTFFGWSLTQVFMCSLTGALMELVSEIVFSPIGFKVCRSWEKSKVGEEYLNRIIDNR